MAKKAKDLLNIKKEVKFSGWQLKMIERAIHVHGIQTGNFMSVAQFIRWPAIAKAHTIIRQHNRIPKTERVQLQVEFERACEEN